MPNNPSPSAASFILLSFGSILITLATGCRTVNSDSASSKFYGADNQSGEMRFEAFVDMALPKGVTTQEELFREPSRADVLNIIERQIQHLYASFSVHDAFVDNPGILEAKGTPELISAKIDRTSGVARITYAYKDRVVFKKKVFKKSDPSITFVMPRDPVTIYKKTLNSKGYNPCTDKEYNGEEDFWYFWNPNQEGCKISKSDLVKVTAELIPKPNTKKTYPEYDRILGDNGNGRTVKVAFLVGIDESFRNGDLGKQAYNEVISLLTKNGFSQEEADRRHSKLTLHRDKYDVEIDMELVNPDSKSFLESAVAGLENADIFIYDGHSGLGSYLGLSRFEKELGRRPAPPINKSQIFYFNGCSTFPYYNADYFALKRSASDRNGSRNLDILTTSVGATFDVGARHDAEFLSGLLLGKRPSWQTILNRIYEVDPAETTLTHVNGDEDNPSNASGQ